MAVDAQHESWNTHNKRDCIEYDVPQPIAQKEPCGEEKAVLAHHLDQSWASKSPLFEMMGVGPVKLEGNLLAVANHLEEIYIMRLDGRWARLLITEPGLSINQIQFVESSVFVTATKLGRPWMGQYALAQLPFSRYPSRPKSKLLPFVQRQVKAIAGTASATGMLYRHGETQDLQAMLVPILSNRADYTTVNVRSIGPGLRLYGLAFSGQKFLVFTCYNEYPSDQVVVHLEIFESNKSIHHAEICRWVTRWPRKMDVVSVGISDQMYVCLGSGSESWGIIVDVANPHAPVVQVCRKSCAVWKDRIFSSDGVLLSSHARSENISRSENITDGLRLNESFVLQVSPSPPQSNGKAWARYRVYAMDQFINRSS